MRPVAPLLVFLCILITGSAQQTGYQAFTTKDGLPSNYVYQCVEDDHGFLWVTTNAGIARFDGKYFQVFTKEHGLPDNEVLDVVKEKSGRIWVSCFKQLPAYFDEVHNRFYTVSIDTLMRNSVNIASNIFSLPEGGMFYHNDRGSFVFRNAKLVAYCTNYLVKYLPDGSFIQCKGDIKEGLSLLHTRGDTLVDSIKIAVIPGQKRLVNTNGKFVITSLVSNPSGASVTILSDFEINPLRYKITEIRQPEPFFYPGTGDKYFYLLSNTGNVHVYDNKTLKKLHYLGANYLPNGFYKDRKGNFWVGTIDQGLLFYRNKNFRNLLPQGSAHSTFISITKKDNKLLAGNYYGEVVEFDHGKIVVQRVIRKMPSRQRKIITVGKDVYTFSDDGVFLNYSIHLKHSVKASHTSAKTAVRYNDSTIILGMPVGVSIINTRKRKITHYLRYKRANSMAKVDSNMVYLGSTDGLHRFYPDKELFESLQHIHPFLKERVEALCVTGDGLVWVANSGSGLGIMKNNRLIAQITAQNGLISNNCRSLVAGRKGQVWLGTTQGISIVNYTLDQDSLSYTVQNLSENDGLSSNEINEMMYDRDSIFATTGNGISVIPADVHIPPFNIPVKLIRISIDQQDTIITNRYRLDQGSHTIAMQFAAIELGGHFRNFQYRMNKDSIWTVFSGTTLTIQPGSGSHRLQVRALDVNGRAGADILTIDFSIAIPFWKSIWFWLLVGIIMQLLIWYTVNRWQKTRKEKRMKREMVMLQTASLEQQAFTSLMNPHFIFNALNSVQHYINVQDRKNANRYLSDFASLIRKNFEAAQQSFIPLEQELDHIRIYLRLEHMRFSDRFEYRINVDDTIDIEDWMVPTMMLQPLLENAVLHGIMPSSLYGELGITISERNNYLVIRITDNGIGMENSLALKQGTIHKSHGMELIRKRVAALSQLAAEPVTIQTFPVSANDNNPGNTTEIRIPAGLYENWLSQSRLHQNPQQ